MTSQRDIPRPNAEPESLIGAWRRFGPTGPAYQGVAVGPRAHVGEPTMRIRVLETGEEIDYRLAEILADPEG